eukprot:CAMPEP_0167819818 /NCGR_PEP_ID=MMETSP0112_2-20121227/5659_1 /TAXON_ID=91324 /ORGANISM="Lotharella globosa, Strain CCCM811" /LENGTH=669 /DNA_ID=CAMNT_0007720131 /DNA_START=668 /DNA_END=2677 /DNA_ORIENTATION=+
MVADRLKPALQWTRTRFPDDSSGGDDLVTLLDAWQRVFPDLIVQLKVAVAHSFGRKLVFHLHGAGGAVDNMLNTKTPDALLIHSTELRSEEEMAMDVKYLLFRANEGHSRRLLLGLPHCFLRRSLARSEDGKGFLRKVAYWWGSYGAADFLVAAVLAAAKPCKNPGVVCESWPAHLPLAAEEDCLFFYGEIPRPHPFAPKKYYFGDTRNFCAIFVRSLDPEAISQAAPSPATPAKGTNQDRTLIIDPFKTPEQDPSDEDLEFKAQLKAVAVVNKNTPDDVPTLDVAKAIAVCDRVNATPRLGWRAKRTLRKLVVNGNDATGVLALNLMDMLVKNAPNFRKQLNDASLASAVVKTLPKSVRNPQGKRFVNLDKNSVVKSEKINKTLLLIQRWATVLSKWKEAYDELVGRNCEFPEPLKDEISPLDFCDEKVPAPKPHEFADKDCRSVVEVFTLLKDMIRAEKAAPKNTVSEPAVNRKLSQEQLSRMSFEQIMSYTLEQSFVQAKLDKDNRNRNSKTLAKDPVINHLMGEVARLESLLQERIGTEALDYEEVAEIMQCLEMLKQIRVLYSSVVANDKAISETTSTALSNPALPGFREDVKKSKTRTTGGVKRTSKDVKSTAGYRTNREPQASAPVPTVDLLEFVFDRQESGESDIDENLFHRENNRSQRSR